MRLYLCNNRKQVTTSPSIPLRIVSGVWYLGLGKFITMRL
jgi:hypothetical protein